MKLTFLGAAGTVTGSKTLVRHKKDRFLVDCGLFQGYKNLRQLNWIAFPFEPSALSAVVLTHAHIDHSGALPLLMKHGFKGPIYATPSTIELCHILLPDSAQLQEEEANFANKHHTSKHSPAMPLYTVQDARRLLKQLKPLPFNKSLSISDEVSVRLRPAGHILGAASAEITAAGRTVLFSGDLGRPDDHIMHPPAPIEKADCIVVESTYGDRLHPDLDTEHELSLIVNRTIARGGSVVLPSFAVGRAQALLYAIWRLKQRHAIPDLPVFLDSPMAINMTEIYHRHRHEHRLSDQECNGMFGVAKMLRTVEDSRSLNDIRYPSIIISASGMATGGRVLHHLRRMAPDRRNSIVFAGYQAAGTRGARMVAGEKTVRIFGEEVPVNAEIHSLEGMSAHADAQQVVDWLKTCPTKPGQVFLTHGEPGPADQMRQRIERDFGWSAFAPLLGQQLEVQ